MMRCFFASVLSGVIAASAGCQGGPEGSPAANDRTADVSTPADTAVIVVHGMGCPQCANNVDTQLLKVPGVESVSIDMGTGEVLARLSPSNHPTREQLVEAIDHTGFTLVRLEMPR